MALVVVNQLLKTEGLPRHAPPGSRALVSNHLTAGQIRAVRFLLAGTRHGTESCQSTAASATPDRRPEADGRKAIRSTHARAPAGPARTIRPYDSCYPVLHAAAL